MITKQLLLVMTNLLWQFLRPLRRRGSSDAGKRAHTRWHAGLVSMRTDQKLQAQLANIVR